MNPIQFQFTIQVNNPPLMDGFQPGPQSIAETNVGVVGGVALIPTSDTLIPGLTGLTAEGIAVLQNLDPTNYILWGPDNGSGAIVVCGKLKPGETFAVRIAPTVVLRAQAHTASCKLLVRIWED